MHIVINGGGEVGSFLARNLLRKGNLVALIERDTELLERLEEELPPKTILVEGDGCDAAALRAAGTERAEVFASVTFNDEDNLAACQLAKAAFGVKRVIARVNSPRNERTFNLLGVEAISSTTVISSLIEHEMTLGDIIRLHTLEKGQLALVEVEVAVDAVRMEGTPIAELGLPEDVVLVSIARGDELLIPRGRVPLFPGDRVLAVTATGHEKELSRLLGKNGHPAKRPGRKERKP